MRKSANLEVGLLDAESSEVFPVSKNPQDETQAGALKHNRRVHWDDELSPAQGSRGEDGEGLPVPSQPNGNHFQSSQEGDRQTSAAVPASTMANDLLTQPETDSQAAAYPAQGHELDALMGKAFEEKSTFQGLYEGIRDIFFPPKLPPLELTSTPIPVPDRMKVKANPLAIGISTTFNVSILLILLFFIGKRIMSDPKKPPEIVNKVELTEFKAVKNDPESARGGGGSPDKIDASKGRIPPRTPPNMQVPKLIQPPTPTIDVQKDIQIPDDPTLPNFGMAKSPNVTVGSLGNGNGMGLGNGNGSGYGPGSNGGAGGGVYRPGGGVSTPQIIYSEDPEFSDEARRAKYQGVVVVSLIVDAQGNPQNVHVERPLGMGLDEKAIEAIRKYKFKPGKKDGKNVAVMVDIEVNFHLY